MKLIDKDEAISRIKRRIDELNDHAASYPSDSEHDYLCRVKEDVYKNSISIIKSLEVKDVDLMMHTIIAECCDWLAKNTNLSHDKIEECRNLMLTVKEEQLKTQKGE